MSRDSDNEIAQPLLFEDLPDDLDETWTHVAVFGGLAKRDPAPSFLGAARTYRWAAELVLEAAVRDGELWRTIDPVLFLYRHALELYLKALMPGERGRGHDLKALVEKLPALFAERFAQDVPAAVMDRLREFAGMDNKNGTVWRYPETESPVHEHGNERMLDLRKMKRVLDIILDGLDHASLSEHATRGLTMR